MSSGIPTVPVSGVPAALAIACGSSPDTAPDDRAMSAVLGNRCGHVPTAPRFFTPPDHHAPHPRILVRLQEAIQGYFNQPGHLPSLNAANGSPRRQRSERREACLALLGALIHYLDLVTLRIGLPRRDGTLGGLSMAFLAERAGLGLRRAERASHDLAAAGLLRIQQRIDLTAAGDPRGRPATRWLPLSLFKVFGLERWLQRERDKAAQRQRRHRQQQEAATASADAGRRELNLEAAQRRAAAQPESPSTDTDCTRRDTARAALGALLHRLRGRPPS